MFNRLKNRLKREVIQEIIDELQSLCIEYDTKTDAKTAIGEDVTFEIGIGYGLRTVLKKVRDIEEQCE